ncbi:Mediator of RNA polymerase II transcription subunit 8 [Acorus gramineus]|uniref:Mediator of RNA polymerase II transcription subunit 8 n=1 Tax=Acorus gramineus TaxID=55184 RepID=A0AAV9BGR2_ACOGR|nr:Mediator of RNA polymerase II transcription subunit 8 [Acorus gramineus]
MATAMEIGGAPPQAAVAAPGAQDQQQPQTTQAPPAEKLNQAVVQQLNLDSVKTRALGLFKAISRILEDFDTFARANSSPKWQDALGQFSMVNLELFNIVEDIKKVSKAFVVHPKNVNAENATVLPVMLSSKLLPEMEVEDNAKREQLLLGMQNLPVPMQIERLKTRIDMIGAACESAEKVIADSRKAYGLGSRQTPSLVPTIDKAHAAKIHEQENLIRSAMNFGEGLRILGDQRHLPSSLPPHLVDVLTFGDNAQRLNDNTSVYARNTASSFPSNSVTVPGAVMQPSGAQPIGRSVPSPGISGGAAFDSASTPPLPYANSPRSSTKMMNMPSPQQQAQLQQQQRQSMAQLPQHQQQFLAQQQLRQSTSPGILGQNTVQQLHDLQGQSQQKLQQVQHQMQYSQPLAQQQFQNRQLQSGQMQHNIMQNQLNQNQLRSHLGQFSGAPSNALFNTAQTSPNSQMVGPFCS